MRREGLNLTASIQRKTNFRNPRYENIRPCMYVYLKTNYRFMD